MKKTIVIIIIFAVLILVTMPNAFSKYNYKKTKKVGNELQITIESVIYRTAGDLVREKQSYVDRIAELQQEDLIVPDDAKKPQRIKGLDVRIEAGSETEKPSFEAPILHKYTDMQDLLLLDPIHEVDEAGWPVARPAVSP